MAAALGADSPVGFSQKKALCFFSIDGFGTNQNLVGSAANRSVRTTYFLKSNRKTAERARWEINDPHLSCRRNGGDGLVWLEVWAAEPREAGRFGGHASRWGLRFHGQSIGTKVVGDAAALLGSDTVCSAIVETVRIVPPYKASRPLCLQYTSCPLLPY